MAEVTSHENQDGGKNIETNMRTIFEITRKKMVAVIMPHFKDSGRNILDSNDNRQEYIC